MAKRYYLAYGSNLNVRQMAVRCPSARVIGMAEIPNYELLFKGSKTGSYLTIEPKEGSAVPVAVWDITPEDELALDRYEGYPTFYYKAEVRLPVRYLGSGRTVPRTAFVYIMHEDRPLGLPTRQYVNTCLEGYVHFGFDEKRLEKAIRKSGRKGNENRK